MADSSPSATFNTHKLGLLEPILFGNIAAKGASLAGVIRRHRNKQPASPSQCVFQLAAKLAPLLVEPAEWHANLLSSLRHALVRWESSASQPFKTKQHQD